MKPVLSVSLLAFLVVLVRASGSGSLLTRQASSGGLGLDNIPDACRDTCSPIESTITSCQELTCLCNNDVAKQIADCANCLVAVSGDSGQQSTAQDVVDQYTNACITSGEPISSIQVSSVAPSSSSSPSSSSTSSLIPSDSDSDSGSGSATSTSESESGTSSTESSSAAGRWSVDVGLSLGLGLVTAVFAFAFAALGGGGLVFSP